MLFRSVSQSRYAADNVNRNAPQAATGGGMEIQQMIQQQLNQSLTEAQINNINADPIVTGKQQRKRRHRRNKEPIEETLPTIYTPSNEGVQPAYDNES